MRNFVILFTLLLSSCSNQGSDEALIGDWNLVKKEKFIKVMSDKYTPISVDIFPNESYNFVDKNEIIVNSGLGKPNKGIWEEEDSVLKIRLKNESKEFKIQRINNDTMVLMIDKFRLTFANDTNHK